MTLDRVLLEKQAMKNKYCFYVEAGRNHCALIRASSLDSAQDMGKRIFGSAFGPVAAHLATDDEASWVRAMGACIMRNEGARLGQGLIDTIIE